MKEKGRFMRFRRCLMRLTLCSGVARIIFAQLVQITEDVARLLYQITGARREALFRVILEMSDEVADSDFEFAQAGAFVV